MKKKYKVAIAIVIIIAILVPISINAYISSGTKTQEAENFTSFLTAYEWRSSSDKGAGFMNFGTDGSFNYRGTDDGNGPWGYDIYDNFQYNSILNVITAFFNGTLGKKSVAMKVIDYNLGFLVLEIEGYQVEFVGKVKEEIKPDYENSKFALYRGEENHIEDSYTACNILEKYDDRLECTLEGYDSYDLGSVTYTLTDEIKYEEFIVTLNNEEYETNHKELSQKEAEERIKEMGYTEFIWCNKEGNVEKILFYNFR